MTYVYGIVLPASASIAYNTWLESLIDEAAEVMNIDRTHLFRKDRSKLLKYTRWIIWEMLYSFEAYSLKSAGAIFGGYHHTTVLHGIQTLRAELKENKLLQANYEMILQRSGLGERKRSVSGVERVGGANTVSSSYYKEKLRRIRRNKKNN